MQTSEEWYVQYFDTQLNRDVETRRVRNLGAAVSQARDFERVGHRVHSIVGPTGETPWERFKKDLRRRAVLLCCSFARNLAFYRAGQNQGKHLLDASERTASFWRQANSNFIDMCVLEWCKIFADRDAVHLWKNTVSDPVKFEADLLAHLNISPVEFTKHLDDIRFYRNKFVAHLDGYNQMDIPTLKLLEHSVWFYHAHIVTNEVQPGDLAEIPTDTPQRLTLGYRECIDEAVQVFQRFPT